MGKHVYIYVNRMYCYADFILSLSVALPEICAR